MTNEEKLAEFAGEVLCHYKYENYSGPLEEKRREILQLMAASQPGEPGKAQCPKCGSFNVTLEYCSSAMLGVHCVTCRICKTSSDSTGTLFAQFFRPSAPSPLPTYEEAEPHLGYAWPGYSFDGKKEEIKYAFNRMRDAMQKCLGVAELTPIETDNKATQKGEKFRIVQVNKNCFKMYLFGHFIGAMASEHLAHAREKSIADNINRYIDAEVRRRLPKAKTVAPSGSAVQEPHGIITATADEKRKDCCGDRYTCNCELRCSCGLLACDECMKDHLLKLHLVEPEGRAESAAKQDLRNQQKTLKRLP